MERSERLSGLAAFRLPAIDPGAVATWLFAALTVTYLSLEGGGYDPIVRGEVAVVVWLIAGLGITTGALRLPYSAKAAWILGGLLVTFTLWTALSLTWTQSSERTVTELARVAGYLGILVLALGIAGRGYSRQLLTGATFAVALVCGLGVLSRLEPGLFPDNVIGTFLPGIEIERRLAYPLNYSSAVGAYAGLAIPLILAATAYSRTIPGQALAAAALPLAGFALYLATSGTGLAAAVAGAIVFFALAPDRLPKLATFALGAGGTAILAAGLSDRAALDRGLVTPALERQGGELLAIAIVVCLGVALVQVAISLAVRYGERPAALQISRRNAWLATAATIAFAIPIGLAAGLPDTIDERWQSFQGRGTAGVDQTDRNAAILDPSSSGRYQFWESAVDAGKTDPLQGIGPGTFELWWTKDPEYFGFVRDAHSLYAETFAELGWIGLLAIAGLLLGALAIGAARCARIADPTARLGVAAASAAIAAFAVAAALDWLWEIAALPAIAMLLLAIIAIEGRDGEADPTKAQTGARRGSRTRAVRRDKIARGATLAFAAGAIAVIALPLAGATNLRESQIAYTAGDIPASLDRAEAAAANQPYAAAPLIQEASLLELQGRLPAAVAAAEKATASEPADYRNWLVLSRLQARAGKATAAVAAFEQATKRNPRLAPIQ